MNDVKCPYCGHEQEIDHGGSYSYTEEIDHEYECINCNKDFIYRIRIQHCYIVKAIDEFVDDEVRFDELNKKPRSMGGYRATTQEGE